MAKLKKHQLEVAKLFMVPAVIGGVIAWITSGDVFLGLIICISVLVGNWIGYSLIKKR